MQLLLPAVLAGLSVWMYRKKKIPGTWMSALLLCAAGISALMLYEAIRGAESQVTYLERDPSAAGTVTVPLEAQLGEKRYPVGMEVPGHLRTAEERRQLLEEQAAVLDPVILGDNDSPDHIVRNLSLPVSFEESGITAVWSSDRPEWLGWDGTLSGTVPAEGGRVTVKGTLYLEGESLEVQRTYTLFPSEEEAAIGQRLLKSAEDMNAGREEDRWLLPERDNGLPLVWYRKNENAGMTLCLLLLLAAVLLPSVRQKREEERENNRRKALWQQYPGFVSSLHLYLCAGLGLRKAMERMAYAARRNEGDKRRRREIDEEIAHIWTEIENGVSEQAAWQHFGDRCSLPVYRELALLLIQNRIHGASRLPDLLEREAGAAFETRKRQARAEGEKASVRLILPMGMMLVVVMALIMVPALMNF